MNIESLQSVLLDAACEKTEACTLSTLVAGLNGEPEIALARIWLLAPGDICERCRLATQCPNQTSCLHLKASAGTPNDPESDWSRLDGEFCRMPIGVRKIGAIGAGGGPILLTEIREGERWIARPEWAAAEGIRSFAGQPLLVQGETIGVLGMFSRKPISDDDFRWLRVFADHAATAIENARAYDEIDALRRQLEDENEYLRAEVNEAVRFGNIIGSSPALAKALQQVELVAPTDANVLIQGESGTGKELIARSIHERSRRSNRPMIKVNCATVPKELFESEFFGHVQGSFTGAVKDRKGRFELADGGTLFLDEIGEIPVDLQSKLLRVLQEGEFERVGDATSRSVDVRVISATNRDLQAEIEEGRFRQDLYYRLSVFPIHVPPLSARPEDVEALALHFMQVASNKHALPPIPLTRKHLSDLAAHDWPGNVRELQHVIEQLVILASGGAQPNLGPLLPRPSGAHKSTESGGIIPLAKLKLMEKESILAALKRAGGKVYGSGGAAELLGVKPTTLASRLKALGIDRREAR